MHFFNGEKHLYKQEKNKISNSASDVKATNESR